MQKPTGDSEGEMPALNRLLALEIQQDIHAEIYAHEACDDEVLSTGKSWISLGVWPRCAASGSHASTQETVALAAVEKEFSLVCHTFKFPCTKDRSASCHSAG